ncbi:MAG TPA: hypothetical protein VHA56_09515 [Mucilaginibacter sp.]|nr:hypothetical protein [Mucilaginibacter sp.]
MSTPLVKYIKVRYPEVIIVAMGLFVYVVRHFLQTDWTRELYFPLCTGALLLFMAWLLFHLITYPNIAAKRWDRIILGTAFATVLLIFAALRINSIYQVRSLLADGIGAGIIFGLLELWSGSQRHLWKVLIEAQVKVYRILAFLSPFISAGLLLWLALTVTLPSPLWSGGTGIFLYWGGAALVTGYYRIF